MLFSLIVSIFVALAFGPAWALLTFVGLMLLFAWATSDSSTVRSRRYWRRQARRNSRHRRG